MGENSSDDWNGTLRRRLYFNLLSLLAGTVRECFLALIVGVIIVDRKECIFVWKRDFAFLLLFIVLLAGGMAYVLSKSLDTVKIVLNTAYPGARIATGGGFLIGF